LHAPVDGTIQQLEIHTIGGVVQAAQSLMRIVPDAAPVEVEASLENRDAGFVVSGQPAEVKVETFDYTKYGTVPAHVKFVSRDAIEDKKGMLPYSIRLLLDRSTIVVNGHATTLSPGLAVTVDVKTGRRRVIEYLLSPLLHRQYDSFHER
jgi:hemolysin D